MSEQTQWVGQDRRGDGRQGVTADPPADLTARLFRQGYRWATVEVGGRVVGEVTRTSRRRLWWAEGTDETRGRP